jgi:citrate synthase
MDPLKAKFKEKATALYAETKALLKEHGDKVVGEVTLTQVFGGMRGVKSMVWDPSQLDANEGIRFRGYNIPQLRELLPKADGDKEPLPEGLFWLMLVGELPTKKQVDWLTDEWEKRAEVPAHTFAALDALSSDTHPMTQFSMAIVSMQSESVFAKRYAEGMSKTDYWDATYEDAMNLIAKLPRVAAYIYRRTFHNGDHIAPDTSLDWAGNFAHMLGMENKDFMSLMRLYLTIHADHEGGNASAHSVHLTGSIHGLANQEVIKWIFEMCEELNTTKPTKEQIAGYVNKTIAARKVIPGYGHAVLREPDPRFTAQKVFAEEYIKDDDYVNIVWNMFDVVPGILGALGKVKNPNPNVDAHSGALLVHYGLKEYSFYTVLFGVSRALGVLSALVWSRAMGFPLERPKSVTTDWVKEFISEK